MKIGNKISKLFSRFLPLTIVLVTLTASSLFAGSDRFVDSDDYKSKDFKKGILADYNDLEKARDVDWGWVAPGVQLSDYRVEIGSFEDATGDVGKGEVGRIKSVFNDFIERLKGGKGSLTADFNIFELQKYSPGKAWIPFAGGHQMQAGMGVEVLLKDKSGKTVGKIRHFARNGITFDSAAQEVAGDVKKFISNK